MIDAVLEYGFLQRALVAGALASICCGIIGSYVVINRLGYLAGGIAHSVLAGLGMANYFGFDPTLGALAVALLSALLIGWIRLTAAEHQDTLIGTLWALGMAVGILFISATPGYNSELMSYLFGNILLATRAQLLFMGLLCAGILLLVAAFYRQLHAVSFDAEFARLRGVPVNLLYLLLLCLVAMTTVLMMQLVGLILVIALLTLPAAIAGQYTHRLLPMMGLALGLGLAFTGTGTLVSFATDLPTGSVIVVIAGLTYFASTASRKALRRST
jgi:zinc transport system permease protein